MQERSLIRRLKQHQPQALEELITTYSPYVGTIIRNIIGKYLAEPDVEELTADVFLAVWEHTDQLKAGKLTAYLAAIARNRAKNRIRSYHETVNLEDLVEIGSEEDVEGSIDQKILGNCCRTYWTPSPQRTGRFWCGTTIAMNPSGRSPARCT